MTITLQAVNELIASLESAGELSIRETKVMALAKAYVQLAAENMALKQAAEFATASDMWIEQADGMLDYRYHEWYVDVLKTAMETPATDRIVAGIKAAIEYPKNNSSSKGWTIDPEFLGRVVERAGTFYGYHPGLEEAESALLAGLDLLREGAK